MSVRFPLWLKIGLFAGALVAATCGAIGYWAVLLPADEERAARERQYTELAKMLAASAVLPADILNNERIHPDLVYVVRTRGGNLAADASVVHARRLEPIDPSLAALVTTDPEGALAALHPMTTGVRNGLRVQRVRLKTPTGNEELALGFSTVKLEKELREKLRAALLFILFAVACSIAAAMLFARPIAQPVRALARAMERVSKGIYDSVDVGSRDEVGLLARSFNDMVRGLKERERLKGTLARYVSDDVAQRILTEQSDLDLKSELRDVSVLFLDVRGFTSLSERMPPSEIVVMLNEVFEAVIEIVASHHGTLNKFIGDAVMAIYGAPGELDDAAMHAVRTAVDIQKAVALNNARRRQLGQEVIAVGIGINSGLVLAGNIGSARRMEYTVIGDEVNLAQRLQAFAREGEVIISQSTCDRLGGRVEVRALEPIEVKGKALPVRAYEVVGLVG